MKAAKLVVAAYVVGGLATVLSVLWRKMVGSQTRIERARLLYLFIGAFFAVLLLDRSTCSRGSGVPYPLEGLGSIALTIFMFFLSQTLQRHRLLDLHEFLGKIVVVSALGLVLVIIYGGLVSWVGDRPELFYFNTVVASFVILSFFEPLREKVEEWVVATLFHERYELVQGLEKLRDRIGNVIEPAALAMVLDGLVETAAGDPLLAVAPRRRPARVPPPRLPRTAAGRRSSSPPPPARSSPPRRAGRRRSCSRTSTGAWRSSARCSRRARRSPRPGAGAAPPPPSPRS